MGSAWRLGLARGIPGLKPLGSDAPALPTGSGDERGKRCRIRDWNQLTEHFPANRHEYPRVLARAGRVGAKKWQERVSARSGRAGAKSKNASCACRVGGCKKSRNASGRVWGGEDGAPLDALEEEPTDASEVA
jgi:hypothetical protein